VRVRGDVGTHVLRSHFNKYLPETPCRQRTRRREGRVGGEGDGHWKFNLQARRARAQHPPPARPAHVWLQVAGTVHVRGWDEEPALEGRGEVGAGPTACGEGGRDWGAGRGLGRGLGQGRPAARSPEALTSAYLWGED